MVGMLAITACGPLPRRVNKTSYTLNPIADAFSENSLFIESTRNRKGSFTRPVEEGSSLGTSRLMTTVMRVLLCATIGAGICTRYTWGQNAPLDPCPRPAAGGVVPEPYEVESRDGVLNVQLTYRNYLDGRGQMRYCYTDASGGEAPLLRVKRGDLVVLNLKNELSLPLPAAPGTSMAAQGHSMKGACGGGEMSSLSTNLHFHGLTIPPICHQDDVLQTFIPSRGSIFEYRFRIPADEAPGLYWYHPHIHGLTSPQVLGGASGGLLVEGIERANLHLAGLAERVFIIRDQDLLNPNAQPLGAANQRHTTVIRDNEGDVMNMGTDGGTPAKDLSINFVPVAFPQYTSPLIPIKPLERQLWRVLNASAITYLDLKVLLRTTPQPLGVVSLDGVPIDEHGVAGNRIIWESHILLPPAGRVEFMMNGPPAGASASFVTGKVDTGPAGENDPTRPLATIVAGPDAPEPRRRLEATPSAFPPSHSAWLGDVKPVGERKLYFSEKAQDPANPASPTIFCITVEGQTPAPFDPMAREPNVTVHQGDVEDWVIENRTREVHAFHIHQTHFMLLEWNGVPVDEPFLRDTINVTYWDGKSRQYPSVKLRMDFRDPQIVGTFLYHCHLLEHEDGGMMGTIRVLPAEHSAHPSLSPHGGL
jgi:FtsP/CotA-like multicopper oxidase with cupredoxin domain